MVVDKSLPNEAIVKTELNNLKSSSLSVQAIENSINIIQELEIMMIKYTVQIEKEKYVKQFSDTSDSNFSIISYCLKKVLFTVTGGVIENILISMVVKINKLIKDTCSKFLDYVGSIFDIFSNKDKDFLALNETNSENVIIENKNIIEEVVIIGSTGEQ